jgi:cysteine synthase A
MEALCSQVHIITESEPEDRPAGCTDRLREVTVPLRHRYVWLNQYTNPENWKAHYRTTAPEIAAPVPEPGRAVHRNRHDSEPSWAARATSGSGTGRAGRRHRPRWLAAFGGPPARRMIPVSAPASVRLCSTRAMWTRSCASRSRTPSARAPTGQSGFLFGGSTGTVVSGAMSWMTHYDAGISPRSPSLQTSASAISTPSTVQLGAGPLRRGRAHPQPVDRRFRSA